MPCRSGKINQSSHVAMVCQTSSRFVYKFLSYFFIYSSTKIICYSIQLGPDSKARYKTCVSDFQESVSSSKLQSSLHQSILYRNYCIVICVTSARRQHSVEAAAVQGKRCDNEICGVYVSHTFIEHQRWTNVSVEPPPQCHLSSVGVRLFQLNND